MSRPSNVNRIGIIYEGKQLPVAGLAGPRALISTSLDSENGLLIVIKKRFL